MCTAHTLYMCTNIASLTLDLLSSLVYFRSVDLLTTCSLGLARLDHVSSITRDCQALLDNVSSITGDFCLFVSLLNV